MPAMAVPLSADKVDAWRAWGEELTGSRKAEFEDMNRRHDLTEHRAYLQQTPDGNYLALVVHEGPGADAFVANAVSSDHEFDRWFAAKVSELHGLDFSGPMPPAAQRVI